MPKQTTINDAQIRAVSVQVEQLAHNIQSQALLLRDAFNELYPNLQFADPVRDVAFDRYLLCMANAKLLCDQMPSLAYQAREMQTFGLPDPVADATHLNRVMPQHDPEIKVGADLRAALV